MRPMQMTCDDHNGHNPVYVQEWDGKNWKQASDWFEPMDGRRRAAARAGRGGLCQVERSVAGAHRALREDVT